MCGRYYFDIDEKELKEIVEKIGENLYNNFKTGEIFPTNIAPIITDKGTTLAKWGFPKWDSKGVVINARTESLTSKKMFQNLITSNRCVIPASGFFEWKQNPFRTNQKDKYYFKRPNSILYMAGLFDYTNNETRQLSMFEEETKQLSYVIITRNANSYISSIHDRMPLILSKEEMKAWLNYQDLNTLIHKNNPVLESFIS